jgi:hypothetical protein
MYHKLNTDSVANILYMLTLRLVSEIVTDSVANSGAKTGIFSSDRKNSSLAILILCSEAKYSSITKIQANLLHLSKKKLEEHCWLFLSQLESQNYAIY